MNFIDTISNFSSQTIALIAMGLCYVLLFTEKLNRAVVTVFIAAAPARIAEIGNRRHENHAVLRTLFAEIIKQGMQIVFGVSSV